MDEPAAKRPRGRPRKSPPPPPPEPKRDPRRFAAAYAAHLIRHHRAKPTTAAEAAALIFADNFGIYEKDLVRPGRAILVAGLERLRQLPSRKFNTTAVFPGSKDEARRPDDAQDWPIARLRSEAKMIDRARKRLEGDADQRQWIAQSVMLIGIFASGRASQEQLAALRPIVQELGWDEVLARLAHSIVNPQNHFVSMS